MNAVLFSLCLVCLVVPALAKAPGKISGINGSALCVNAGAGSGYYTSPGMYKVKIWALAEVVQPKRQSLSIQPIREILSSGKTLIKVLFNKV